MNTTRAVAVAILTLTGFAAAQAGEAAPAWRTDGFVMEETVVTVEAPDYCFAREIDVIAMSPQFKVAVAALEAPDVGATPVPGEAVPRDVVREVHGVEVVEAGAAQAGIGEDEAAGPDDVDGHAQTGGEPEQGAGVLRNIGLVEGKAQGS